jgi:lactoylglutathione lyase
VTVSLKFDGYIAVLFVKDLNRARDFYQNVMGLELQYGDDVSGAFKIDPDTLLILDHTGADNLLSPGDVDHQPARGARSVLATAVENVDAAYEELRSRGVEFIRPPEDRSWGLRCAHFKDPDGNIWEIHAPVPDQ